MLQPAFALHDILSQLPEDGLLLTPTNRLRNRCQQVYGASQTAKNWTPPAVESLQGWLEKLWFELQQRRWQPAMKMVLNREQRQLLWQQCVEETLDRGLLNTQQLAANCDTALAQLIQWRIVDDLDNADAVFERHLESFALARGDFPFFEILPKFQRLLVERNAITQDQRDLLIARAFAEGIIPSVTTIALAGFTQISPLAEQIIQHAAQNVEHFDTTPRQGKLQVARCHNLEEELVQAARWAGEKLAHNPDASIGIVVNNLGQCRTLVERVFARVLEPQWMQPHTPGYTLPFNFSAGTPLAKTPVGSASLLLLETLRDRFDYGQLRNLLFSAFWGGSGNAEADAKQEEHHEQHLRSALLRRLQKLELREVAGNTLRQWTEKLANDIAPESPLPAQLNLIGDRARRWQKAPAEVWAQRFSELLALLGWPGKRNPNSLEYQQLMLWESALENFAGLSGFGGSLSLNKALNTLRQIANRMPFQAETRDGPLQILGVLEAGGLAFDHLRLVGFGQQQWPAPPSPNPMLPVQWQKEWKMPRASAERELELAQGLTADLLNASEDKVVSYACEQDGVGQLLSALFPAGDGITDSIDSDALTQHLQQLADSVGLESVRDREMPPLTAEECQQVRGGAGVLKAQALCPMNAQLLYRLGAEQFQPPGIGLSAAERGNLVHEMLAAFWQRCGSAAALSQMDEQQRSETSTAAVADAISKLKPRHPELPPTFWTLEEQRLQHILQQWLPLEIDRPAFTVRGIEAEQFVELDGMTFRLRLDRLDELANGEQLVIDYKTGSTSVSDWLQPRVREPQLPLYALFQPEARAIAFGVVRNGECKYQGCGEISEPIKGIKTVADSQRDKESEIQQWPQLLEHWQQALQQLAGEYRDGHAALVFDRPADNTNQKALWPLNRWPERSQK